MLDKRVCRMKIYIYIFYIKTRMRWGKKRWIKSYPIWIVQNKSVNAIQLVSTFFVLSSFRLSHFMWLSLSLPLSRIHTYMQWIFGFCCHEIWILLFFCLSSNPFQLFFYKKNLELLAFCFDLDIFVSIKKRKRLTQIKCDSSITKLSSFSIILYFMPESWTNKEEKRKFERFHTIFCMIRLSKRFFLRWLPFEILYIQFSKYGANEKGLTHPPPPPEEWRKTKQVERNLMPQYSFVYFWGFTVSNFLFVLPHNDDPFHFSWFVQKTETSIGCAPTSNNKTKWKSSVAAKIICCMYHIYEFEARAIWIIELDLFFTINHNTEDMLKVNTQPHVCPHFKIKLFRLSIFSKFASVHKHRTNTIPNSLYCQLYTCISFYW